MNRRYQPIGRRKRRQSHLRFLGATAILSCASFSTPANALFQQPQSRTEDQQESLSISSSKTKSAAHANVDSHSWNKPTRMADQHEQNFAQQLFSQDSSDFANRLLKETSNANSIESKPSSQDHPFESFILYGIVTLAIASALLTPTIFVDSLVVPMVSSLALLLPWLWIGRASLFTKETVIMCITTFVQLAPRWRQNYPSVVSRVFPMAGELLTKMLLAEAWSRVWRFAGRGIAKFFKHVTLERRQRQQEQANNSQAADEQRFGHVVHEFFDTSIRKGTNKAVLKTLERNVQAAIGTTFDSLIGFMETALLPLVLIPFQGVTLNPKECSL